MSKLAEEMNTFMKMVSGQDQTIAAVDNIKEKQSKKAVPDILQDFPKEVALFKRSPEDFDLADHSKFYEELFDYYSNSGDMPYGTMKARDGDPYEWIQDKLMDEILGKDDEPETPTSRDASHDDFDDSGQYDNDNDWGGFDNFESKLMKDLPEDEMGEWVQEPHEGQKWSGQERNFIQELCLRMDGVSKTPNGLQWQGKSKTWDEGNVLSDKGKLTTVMLWAKRNIDDLYDRMGSEFKVYSDGNDEGDSGRGQSDGNQIIQNIIGKIGTIGEDSNLDEEELTEWVWVLPALATAARVGGPALLKLLKHGAKKAAPVAANTGTAIIKNPGTTLSWAAGGYVFKSVYDIVEKVKDVVGDLMDDTSVESFAEIVWKYKLPVAAVVAVLYGGKKLKDYMAGEEDKGNTTINNYYGSDQQPATENQDRMRHLAGIKTTPTLAVIKNTH